MKQTLFRPFLPYISFWYVKWTIRCCVFSNSKWIRMDHKTSCCHMREVSKQKQYRDEKTAWYGTVQMACETSDTVTVAKLQWLLIIPINILLSKLLELIHRIRVSRVVYNAVQWKHLHVVQRPFYEKHVFVGTVLTTISQSARFWYNISSSTRSTFSDKFEGQLKQLLCESNGLWIFDATTSLVGWVITRYKCFSYHWWVTALGGLTIWSRPIRFFEVGTA